MSAAPINQRTTIHLRRMKMIVIYSQISILLLCQLIVLSEASSFFHGAPFVLLHTKPATDAVRGRIDCSTTHWLHPSPNSNRQRKECSFVNRESTLDQEIVTEINPSEQQRDVNCKSISDEEQIKQLLSGKHKWLGGAVDHQGDGSVYGIPSHSQHVICLCPPKNNNDGDSTTSDSSSWQVHMLPLPKHTRGKSNNGKHHQFKWLRGIIVNETLFGIPSWSQSGVLSVDIGAWRRWREVNSKRIVEEELSDKFVNVVPLPQPDTKEQFANHKSTSSHRWMWHGAALNQNSTAIYCIPSNAHQVLKLDLQTMTTSFLSIPPLPTSTPEQHSKILQSTNKWYGGIRGRDDNAIYGIPYAASSVLRIDANDDTVSLLGDYGMNKYNWHGGVMSQNGRIYAFPAHSEHVLRIDTTIGIEGEERLRTLPINRAEYDVDGVRRYKWLGGSLGADGNVYGMPSDASSVLRIDIETDEVTTFGHVESTSDKLDSDGDALPEKNKWQGGVLGKDGFIYAVPSNAKGVLRIDSRPSTTKGIHNPSRVTVVGNLPDIKDKWQGGFLVKSGVIYGIPENCDRMLEVKPPDLDGDEVAVRML